MTALLPNQLRDVLSSTSAALTGDLRRVLNTGRAIDSAVDELVETVEKNTEQFAAHIEVIDRLTAAVTRLNEQLDQILELTAPIAEAEHQLGRVEKLLHLGRDHDDRNHDRVTDRSAGS